MGITGITHDNGLDITGDNSNGMIVGSLHRYYRRKDCRRTAFGTPYYIGRQFFRCHHIRPAECGGDDDMKGLQISGLGNITGGTSAGCSSLP